MISFSIKLKTIFRIMSKVTHYTVEFGEKTAKLFSIEYQNFPLRYTLPLVSNKGKQLCQQCFEIIYLHRPEGVKWIPISFSDLKFEAIKESKLNFKYL